MVEAHTLNSHTEQGSQGGLANSSSVRGTHLSLTQTWHTKHTHLKHTYIFFWGIGGWLGRAGASKGKGVYIRVESKELNSMITEVLSCRAVGMHLSYGNRSVYSNV